MKKTKHLSLIFFCIYITAVVLMCVIRTDSLPELPKTFLGIPLDKIMHFVMFLPFPILGYMAFVPAEKGIWRNLAVTAILCTLGFGFAFGTERLQAMTAYRSCESADLIADTIGIAVGAVTAAIAIFIKSR